MRRHDLLRIDRAAWDELLRAAAGPGAVLRSWRDRDWPVIRRRGTEAVPVGLSLPPPHRSRRFGFAVEAGAVRAVARPPPLSDLAEELPPALRRLGEAVLDVADRIGVERPRVFGSLMWRHVTGVADHVGPGSDLDCLWEDVRADLLAPLLRELAELPDAARLDGEIVFGDVGAASWRELAGAVAGAAVLVRNETGVALVGRRALGLDPC